MERNSKLYRPDMQLLPSRTGGTKAAVTGLVVVGGA
jgi:hypothetical protein